MLRSVWVTILGAAICACTGSAGDGTGPDYTGPGPADDPNDPGTDGGSTDPGFSGHYFQQPMFFDQDVSALPKAATSDTRQLRIVLPSAGGRTAGRGASRPRATPRLAMLR